MPRHRAAAAFLILASVAACAPAPPAPSAAARPPVVYVQEQPLPGRTRVLFAKRLATEDSFFDAPWPSDARRRGGRPDFTGFPGEDAPVASEYVETARRDVDGFSIAPTIYFRFDGPVVSARLPTKPGDTMSPRSPVFLVDVDHESPERGTFRPLQFRVFERTYKFVPPNTLAAKPVAGFVLRPGTLYAAVVRRDLGDAAGNELGTPRELEILKHTRARRDPAEERLRALHAPAFEALDALGVARADVAGVAVFRTQQPHVVTQRLLEAADHLPAEARPRVLRAASIDDAPHRGRVAPTSYSTIRGYYCTPNFQSAVERAPYLETGGEIRLDAQGRPAWVPVPEDSPYHAAECGGLVRARFVLSIPNRSMPPGGFPLMLSAHGTGGSAHGFLGEDDFAGWAAREGIAVVSTDQPIHGADDPLGARPGSREPISFRVAGIPLPIASSKMVNQLGFYNPLRPAAARDNLRQATVDGYVLAHLMAHTDFAKGQLLGPRSEPPPRFDASRLFYAGHSQGSQSVAVLGALDPAARAVILSGCGGDARLGIVKRRDIAIPAVVGAILGAEPDEIDEFHPLMQLVQTLADPIDPQSYARFYVEPAAGRVPPSVLHIEGIRDSFTPNETAEALAIALRATLVGPEHRRVAGLELLGLPRGVGTVANNAAGGRATIAFSQFLPQRGEDGHFVVYFEPAAAAEVRGFLRTALDGATRVALP